MSNIPEEIKQKISDIALTFATRTGFSGSDVISPNKQLGYIQGGLDGYSLSLQTIAEKDEEIKRLREALEWYADAGNYCYDHGGYLRLSTAYQNEQAVTSRAVKALNNK